MQNKKNINNFGLKKSVLSGAMPGLSPLNGFLQFPLTSLKPILNLHVSKLSLKTVTIAPDKTR